MKRMATPSGAPVAAGASGLLIVSFDALGQIEMRDEAHVRLVDAHAERDGGDDHHAVLADCPHGKLGLVRHPELADDNHVEGSAKRPGNSGCNGHATTRQPEHDGEALKLRLAGIDAPELCQPWGQQAWRVLQMRLEGQRVATATHVV